MTELAHASRQLAPGSLVTARGREWVVLPDSEPDMLVLRPLGGADDEIAAVFPDLEPVDPGHVPRRRRRTTSATPRPPGCCAPRCASGSGPAPGRSGPWPSIAVEPRPYQLVPLLMAMRQDTVRLAICDDVGIGKTIESGLIAAELLAQGEADGTRGALLARRWPSSGRTSCAPSSASTPS